uniref:Uncharacterized protein n=1 Tax=Setaria viridis TaxID=4556 RepID=A0A4U6TSJ2_SETVI|nr:hypothetical protein SEVIR_7G147903v2 [Setaria viridis]
MHWARFFLIQFGFQDFFLWATEGERMPPPDSFIVGPNRPR